MNRGLTLVLAAAALFTAFSAVAAETYSKLAGQYSVYLTVMPSEVIRGPLPPEIPGASPQGPPAARDSHHVMVAIFYSASGMRVEGFAVTARVSSPGLPGQQRDLEPIRIAGQVVYANGFPMLGRGPFRIDVEFGAPYGIHPQQATFYFAQPKFAPPT